MIRNVENPSPPQNPMTFSYSSDLASKVSSQQLEDTSAQMNIINDYFSAGTKYVNSDGKVIINASEERIWFSRCVAFVFATGRIYDAEDDIKLSAVMNYFVDNGENAYLDNHYRTINYQSPLVQDIERKLRIGNGNYHVFMVPVVYADDELIKRAPEPRFKRKGIVDKFTSWESIAAFMKDMIVRYGLITEIDRPHTQTSHEIGSTSLPEEQHIKSRYDELTKFNYNSENGNIAVMKEIDTTLRIKEELTNDYNDRIRKAKMDRKGEYTGHTNNHKRQTLYSQLYEDKRNGMVFDTIPAGTKGVELHLDERYMPTNKVVDEYQLYTDNSYYDAEHNKNITYGSAECRADIPRLMLFATRATSNGARRVNTNVDALGSRTTDQFTHNIQRLNA